MSTESLGEIHKLQADIRTENEIFAWLQAPDLSELPEFTELGMSRYKQIVGDDSSKARLVELLWAIERISEDDQMTVQLLVSGFDRLLLLKMKEEADIYTAVNNVRKELNWPESVADLATEARPTAIVQPQDEPLNSKNWHKHGACRTGHQDAMFTEGAEQNVSKQQCIMSCPAIKFCLRYALENQIDRGVWGGMTERERRALLKKGDMWRKALFKEDAQIAS